MGGSSRNRIAIVGAGFSGSLLTVQLLRRFAPNARIYLFEQNAAFGRGLAYATGNPNHLLNVRAGRMSAFADDADHFVRWLSTSPQAAGFRREGGAGAEAFVPRGLYGAYIQDLLGTEIWRPAKGRNLFIVPDEVVSIQRRGNGFKVEAGGGRRYRVDFVVFAIGNVPNDVAAEHYFGNPWSPAARAGLDPDAPVLLTGTGLTMVDTVISLIDEGHRGTIHAVSRRGLLPRRHGDAPPFLYDFCQRDGRSISRLLHRVRALVRAQDAGGSTWRSIVDSLRPYTSELWQALDDGDRRRFLRHLRPWWEVHRHRMAPSVADRIESLIIEGRLRISAAKMESQHHDEAGITAVFRARGSDERFTIRVARRIDCSGPQCDYERVQSPLVQSLLAQGLARPDPLRLGLDVSGDCALIDRAGDACDHLYALGPMTRGTFWEITSVPDIREQCWQVAARLGRQIAQPLGPEFLPDGRPRIDPMFRE